jgi:2-amino-4-hydroxy-6-hydroxymethyldihydropteridine diphosphokinase
VKSERQVHRHSKAGVTTFIGLGSNLEDPATQVRRAFDALDQIPRTRCLRRSRLYLSRPVGPADQPDYINAAASLQTYLDPHSLLAELQRIEGAHGRIRTRRWGPRTLDLDLLLYGDQVIKTPDLEVPHPGIHHRLFVLLPLRDLSPNLRIPGGGELSALIQACPAQEVRLYASS